MKLRTCALAGSYVSGDYTVVGELPNIHNQCHLASTDDTAVEIARNAIRKVREMMSFFARYGIVFLGTGLWESDDHKMAVYITNEWLRSFDSCILPMDFPKKTEDVTTFQSAPVESVASYETTSSVHASDALNVDAEASALEDEIKRIDAQLRISLRSLHTYTLDNDPPRPKPQMRKVVDIPPITLQIEERLRAYDRDKLIAGHPTQFIELESKGFRFGPPENPDDLSGGLGVHYPDIYTDYVFRRLLVPPPGFDMDPDLELVD